MRCWRGPAARRCCCWPPARPARHLGRCRQAALCPARPATCTYAYAGADRTFTVPTGTTTITVTLTGGSGVSGTPGGASGGKGATVTGSLAVRSGQQLTVVAGGQGQNLPGGAAGGFGYGAGGAGVVSTGYLSGTGGGGGGASAIVTGSTALAVAGGGGGSGAGHVAGAGSASAAIGQSGTLLFGGPTQQVNDGGMAGGQSGPDGGNGSASTSFGGGGGGGGLHGGSGGGIATFYGTGGGGGGTDLVPVRGNVQDGTNSGNGQVTISFTVQPLVISTTSLPAATSGQAYTARLAAAGGVPAYAWSLSAGTLPSGLTLNRATGVISGVPDAAGNYAFTVKVTDSSSTGNTTKALSIAVGSPLASSPVISGRVISGPAVTAVVPVTGCRSA